MSTEVIKQRAGPNHEVVTTTLPAGHAYRKKPCAKCPWKISATGEFPAEAFRISANTSYDMGTHIFACHKSGTEKPTACAGFLLHGSVHNLTVRIGRIQGNYLDGLSDGGHPMHGSYRAMAIANGVDKDDPVLARCRGLVVPA